MLALDHLTEYPKDAVVLHALTGGGDGSTEDTRQVEMSALVMELLAARPDH